MSGSTSEVAMEVGYIYLIRPREFLNLKMDVYKVGMTRQDPDRKINRLNGYPKGSEVILVINVPSADVRDIEGAIIKRFRHRFSNHIDGREYFHGDVSIMKRIIFHTVQHWHVDQLLLAPDTQLVRSPAKIPLLVQYFWEQHITPKSGEIYSCLDPRCTATHRDTSFCSKTGRAPIRFKTSWESATAIERGALRQEFETWCRRKHAPSTFDRENRAFIKLVGVNIGYPERKVSYSVDHRSDPRIKLGQLRVYRIPALSELEEKIKGAPGMVSALGGRLS